MTELRKFTEFRMAISVLLSGLLVTAASLPVAADSPKKLSECGQSLKSGFYKLSKNLNAGKKKSRRNSTENCIVVIDDFVTINLGGFTISGNGKGSGITDGGIGREGIVVKNGGITGFAVGIDLNSSPAARISGIVATKNVGSATPFECNAPGAELRLSGIATGLGSIVTNSIARDNDGVGIKVGSGSRVTGNVANRNKEAGFCIFSSSTVSGNTASRNDLDGMRTGSGSTVRGNTARRNGRDGLFVNSGSVLSGNTAKDNEGMGLTVHCPSLVRGNAAIGNNKNLDLVTDAGECVTLENLTDG